MPRFRNAQQLSDFLGNFITVANANLATLTTLNAAAVTALTAIKTDIDARIAAQIAAEEASESATQATKTSLGAGNDGLDIRTKKVAAVPGLPPALAIQLGLPQRDTVPTPIIPAIPLNHVAHGSETGINDLTWQPGAAQRNITYVIVGKIGAATEFSFVGTSTRARFQHTNQTPGVKVEYKVKATRSNRESAYSNIAIVYGP